MSRYLWLAVFMIALCNCSNSNVRFVVPPPGRDELVLGPGDVFALRVFGEQDLSQDYRVAPDGSVDVPYLGRVEVQGLPPTTVADRVSARLRDGGILRSPQVSVFVREWNSRSISILGQVQRPGTFPFTQNMSIVQAVTLAGGFTGLADQNSVRLTRDVRGSGRHTYRIPMDLITEGRVANVTLSPGDVVHVPERVF